jgi:hypothetical protein
LIVARGDPAPVLQAPEHDLDAVAALVIFDGRAAGLSAGGGEGDQI